MIVDELRSFNRFYTREIGLLDRYLPASDFALPEARVIYELALGEKIAADLGRRLRMDKAQMSRIVGRLRSRGMLTSRASPDHGKRILLALTEAGQAAFRALDAGARSQMEAIAAPIDPDEASRLVSALRDVRAVLSRGSEAEPAIVLRHPQPGDVGWIIHRQMVLYHREYDWDWTYEGLISKILGDFVAGFDPARDDAWVAIRGHGIVGSIFLMKSEEPDLAKLRLLYVEPSARGLGVGRLLVSTLIERARELGYRRLTLWTNDILTAARRIYEEAGFEMIDSAPHHSFGHDLVGQNWLLDLGAKRQGYNPDSGPRPTRPR